MTGDASRLVAAPNQSFNFDPSDGLDDSNPATASSWFDANGNPTCHGYPETNRTATGTMQTGRRRVLVRP